MIHEKFIETVAKRLLDTSGSLEDTCVIVPSRRAVQYLLKALAKHGKKAMFAPKILTLDAWVKSCVDLPIITGLPLVFDLYQVYCDSKKEKGLLPDSFDVFYHSADQIINDFEEIDRYLIDTKLIFKNLLDIRELEAWQFEEGKTMSERQAIFLAFWNDLPELYARLRKKHTVEKITTNAAAYRSLSDSIQKVFAVYPKETFFFVGFNAHSESELSIIKQLEQLGKAEIWVDADEWYVNDKLHEAGYFIRKTIEALGKSKVKGIENYLLNDQERTIQFYESSSNTGQVFIASQLLQAISVEKLDDTLLLLGNEELISPLIRNLPDHIQKANITLGVQMKHTPLRSWISLIFDATLFFKQRNGRFYHKDLKKLLQHPFIANGFNPEEIKLITQFLNVVKRDRLIYMSLDNLSKMSAKLPKIILPLLQLIAKSELSNQPQQLATFQALNTLLFDSFTEVKNEYDKTLIVLFNESLLELQQLYAQKLPYHAHETFKKIVASYALKGGVSFFGNPLDGLQIMGLLETRLLDFETIIAVGVNEDALPPMNRITSFIPFDLRAAFGLPTMRDKQALFAHHFYRLLHRSKHCSFIYGSDQTALNANQKSRYLEQIQLELCIANPKINFTHYLLDFETNAIAPKQQSLVKTPEVLGSIKAFITHEKTNFSATSLANFYACPLNFYYNHILKYRENDDLSDTLEANTMGSIIHKALDYLYRTYFHATDGKEILTKITSEIIEKMIKNLGEGIAQGYQEENFHHIKTDNVGQNHIDFKMIETLLRRYLTNQKEKIEKATVPVYFAASEEKIELMRSFESDFGTFNLHLKGSLDRVECENDTYIIYDYKTGNLDKKTVALLDLDFLSSFEPIKDSKLKAIKQDYSIQLMMYRYLYKLEYPNKKTAAVLTPMMTLTNESIQSDAINDEPLIEDKMDDLIVYMLNNLLDPSVPIQHNCNSRYCKYC